jgi:hypothetical protein
MSYEAICVGACSLFRDEARRESEIEARLERRRSAMQRSSWISDRRWYFEHVSLAVLFRFLVVYAPSLVDDVGAVGKKAERGEVRGRQTDGGAASA